MPISCRASHPIKKKFFLKIFTLHFDEKKIIGWGCVGAHDLWFQRETSMSCCKCYVKKIS